jgi:DNA-binding Lrp family transcriptional regulator
MIERQRSGKRSGPARAVTRVLDMVWDRGARELHTPSLDQLDRQIAAALQLQPRATWRQIAAVIGATESTVRRRAERLLQTGVVRTTVIADAVIPHVSVLMQCACRPVDAAEVARALADLDDVRFVALVTGPFDVVAEMVTPSHQDLARIILRELPAVAGIVRSSTATVLRNFKTSYDWSRDHVGPRAAELEQRNHNGSPPGSPPALDDIDRRILDRLREDGRSSFADLAARCGVTESMARRRVDYLFTRASVRPIALVDPRLLGFDVELLLWLRVDLARLERVAAALASRREVRYVSATSGYSDLVCEVIVRSHNDLYTFLTTVVGTLDGVRQVDGASELVTVKRSHIRLDR